MVLRLWEPTPFFKTLVLVTGNITLMPAAPLIRASFTIAVVRGVSCFMF